eukprot:3209405-Karenia_brevis.AAC.1
MTGFDGLNAELIKQLPFELVIFVWNLFGSIFCGAPCLDNWNRSPSPLLPKVHQPKSPSQFR